MPTTKLPAPISTIDANFACMALLNIVSLAIRYLAVTIFDVSNVHNIDLYILVRNNNLKLAYLI